MHGAVTSKYDNLYWIRLFAIVVIGAGAISLSVLAYFNNNADPTSGVPVYMIFILWVSFGGIYLLYFHKSPPRRIIVSDENILIYEYILQKNTIIKYNDIEDTVIFNQSSDNGRFGRGNSNLHILQLELSDGKIYRISENDFVNYEFLQSAIYEHLPRRNRTNASKQNNNYLR